jgi:hypothetical protein
MTGLPLFYSADIGRLDLELAVLGVTEQPPIDTISFESEAGGDQERNFALPLLPGMDEIVLGEAELAFRVSDLKVDATHSATPVSGGGTRLSLTQPGRLRELVLAYAPTPDTRLVVRPVQDGKAGPPIFAHDPFPSPGPMFGEILAGMSVTALGDSKYSVVFPDVAGSAWELALASGGSVTDLKAVATPISVERVAVAAAPTNLSLSLLGEPPVPLWGNPGTLLPGSGEQSVSFLPIAQRRLSEALKAAKQRSSGDPPPLTLALTLRFHSDSAAKLDVTRRRLSGEYRVRPLGEDPLTVSLAGRPVPITLSAPPALKPDRGHLTLTARLAGRALNGPSAAAGTQVAPAGLLATPERSVAARLPIAARDRQDALVPVANVAIFVATPEAAEIVLELRSDAAGKPGSIQASAVRQLDGGSSGWVDFLFDTPLQAPPGETLWAAARLTRGQAFWHARAGDSPPCGLGAPLVSIDRGASWGEPAQKLGPADELLVQAFHALDPPFPRPRIDFEVPPSPDWFVTAVPQGPAEYRAVELELPSAVLDYIASAAPLAGTDRSETRISLGSDSVLDLVISDAVLGYEPLAP